MLSYSVDFIDFCQEVLETLFKDKELYMKEMKILNLGKPIHQQLLFPIGPNIEFGRKIIKHVPHKIEDKIVKKYDTPLNEFMNCLCLMAFTLVECWRGKVPTGKNLDNFIICIQKPVLYLCFPKLLQGFRKFNEFCLSQSGLESLI